MLQLRGAQLAELDLLSCGMLWISTWAGVDYPKQDYPTPRKSKLNCGLGGVNPVKSHQQDWTNIHIASRGSWGKTKPTAQKIHQLCHDLTGTTPEVRLEFHTWFVNSLSGLIWMDPDPYQNPGYKYLLVVRSNMTKEARMSWTFWSGLVISSTAITSCFFLVSVYFRNSRWF